MDSCREMDSCGGREKKKGRGGRGEGRGRNNKTPRCHFAASARLDYPIAALRSWSARRLPPPPAA